MSADFEGNDKDAVVTQQVLDVIDSYGFKKEGAYNLRLNGLAVCHGDSRHIKIVPKEDRQGIDIYISGEAKEEQVHIPVVMTEEGVDIVFGYPGGAVIPLYDALYDYKDKIKHIRTSHEQGAVHAADGYARSSGNVGVCCHNRNSNSLYGLFSHGVF